MFVDMSTPQGPQKETRGPRQGLERTDSSGRSRDRGTTHTTHSWGLFLHPARVPRDHPRTLRDRTWSCSRASVSSVHKNREGELLPDPEAEWHPPGTPALVMSDSLTTFRERAARCMWAHPIYTQCGYALGAELLDFSHKIWSPSKFWPVRTRTFSPNMLLYLTVPFPEQLLICRVRYLKRQLCPLSFSQVSSRPSVRNTEPRLRVMAGKLVVFQMVGKGTPVF